MQLPKKIVELIEEEQIRQAGQFVPKGGAYLEKLAGKAELLTHDSFDQCLGFVFFYCNDLAKHASYITLLMVSQTSRNTGIGAGLVNHVLKLTAERGYKVCRLEVRKENNAGIKFYESLGFCQIEDRVETYLMESKAS